MRAWLLVAVAACRAPAPVVAPVAAMPPIDATPSVQTIAGRVLLDGKPVPVFGVSIVRKFDIAIFRPVEVEDVDGRFHLPVEPGPWDLVISGPNFARRLLLGKAISKNETLELGDIAVQHGHTIQGVVRDDAGTAVAGARVVISDGGFGDPYGTERKNEAHGTHVAMTDTGGRYCIDDVAGLPGAMLHPQISATRRPTTTSMWCFRSVPSSRSCDA